MKLLKKIGSILLCLLPVVLAFGIQIIVSFGGVFVKLILEIVSHPDLINQMADPKFILDFLSDSQFLAGISAIYAVIAALALGFWYWKQFVPKKQPRREIASLINPKIFCGLVLLMLGMQYISNYVVMILAAINPGWLQTYQDLMESIGAFHGNIIQGAYAFVVGLFCGYVCYQGGSIYLSILFHMLFNIWGTFAPSFLSYDGKSILIHIVIFVLAVCFALAGVFLYQKGLKRRTPMPEAFQNH